MLLTAALPQLATLSADNIAQMPGLVLLLGWVGVLAWLILFLVYLRDNTAGPYGLLWERSAHSSRYTRVFNSTHTVWRYACSIRKSLLREPDGGPPRAKITYARGSSSVRGRLLQPVRCLPAVQHLTSAAAIRSWIGPLVAIDWLARVVESEIA